MDNTDNNAVAELASTASHLISAKMFSLACCVMLFYDILITFGEEVEKIWKQRFSLATILWFMNRYLSPLGYIVIIVSFHANWPKSVCNHYVLYPEVLKIFTSTAIGAIFTLRLYSIYGGSVPMLVGVSILLVAEVAVKIWAFTDGTSVPLPPGLVGCILTGRDSSNDRFVFTWVAELIFDSVIFILTISRTLIIYRRHRQGSAIPLIKIMMRDGIIYFLVIFVANAVTVSLFLTLPPDLKAINASFSTLITSLMVSRLILNLRNQASQPAAVVSYPSMNQNNDQLHLTSNVIGNLGQPVDNHWFSSGSEDSDDRRDAEVISNDVYEMFEGVKQDSSIVSQIVVEVTHSVTTDLRTSTSTTSPAGLAERILLDDSLSPSHPSPFLPPMRRPRSAVHTRDHDERNPQERERERERIQPKGRGSRPSTTNTSGGSAWQPPKAWNLEGDETYELRKPRRQKRPSTS